MYGRLASGLSIAILFVLSASAEPPPQLARALWSEARGFKITDGCTESLRPVDELKPAKIAEKPIELHQGSPLKTLDVNGPSLIGKLLRLNTADGKYTALTCGEGNAVSRYALFDITDAGKTVAIAQLAIDIGNLAKLAVRPGPPPLQALSLKVRSTHLTFYNPNSNSRMEGGPRNRYTEFINDVYDAIKNGRPVSIAADYLGAFGAECNQRHNRCLVLIKAIGFDQLFPEYRKKFPLLPANTFIGLVEDTGGAFYHTQGRKFDIAVRSAKLALAAPPYFKTAGTWVKLKNPCGTRNGGRECVLSNRPVPADVVAAISPKK